MAVSYCAGSVLNNRGALGKRGDAFFGRETYVDAMESYTTDSMREEPATGHSLRVYGNCPKILE
jgi:hypothetical protein